MSCYQVNYRNDTLSYITLQHMHYLQLTLEVLLLLWQRFIIHKSILLSELVSAEFAAQVLKPGIAALTAEQD